MKKRSIVVSCFAGWHGFDLAQALERSGQLECLITLVNPNKIESRYGISHSRIRQLPLASLFHRIELFLSKYANALIKNLYFEFFCAIYDKYTAFNLSSQTRMLIAWHPFASASLYQAKSRGIHTVLDVGSTHPVTQLQLLNHEHKLLGIRPPFIPDRVLKHCRVFNQVDWISIPSTPVCDSFVSHGIPRSKLFINPYGVDSSLFQPIVRPIKVPPFTPDNPLEILIVAGLTPRKGSRLLLNICRHYEADSRLNFTLVGSLDPPYCFSRSDLPSNLSLIQPMPHHELVKLYAKNDIFFLPSIEEGFARVLIEAAFCGLTLLATPSTGIGDLLHLSTRSGYMLADNHPSTAITSIDHILDGSLGLTTSDPSDLQFFTRDSYQRRVINQLTQCLESFND